MSRIGQFVRRYILSSDLPLTQRTINLLCIFGMPAVLCAATARLIEGMPFIPIASMVLMLVFIVITFVLVNVLHKHQPAVYFVLIGLCDVLFPAVFLTNGGIDSGMAAYFALALVLHFLLLKGRARALLLGVNLIVITACYYLTIFLPTPIAVMPLNAFQRTVDHLQSILVTGIYIGAIIVFLILIYETERQHTQDAARQAARHGELLQVVNQVASQLLTAQSECFEQAMRSSMERMAQYIQADRVCLYCNEEAEGTLYYTRAFAWIADAHAWPEEPDGARFVYSETVPEWQASLSQRQTVNGPVSQMSERTRAALKPYGIQSILVLPLFLQNRFWGFISFDDCQRERVFGDEEISVLHSGGLLLANAMVRNSNGITLVNRLAQQELMSDLSQSFISKEPVDRMINRALRVVGEFLGASRTLIVVTDRDTDESRLIYTWFHGPARQLDSSQVGFNSIIINTFPSHMPDEGYVPTMRCCDTQTDYGGMYAMFYRQASVRAFLWAPLYVDGVYWGLLSIEDCERGRAWSKSDAQLAGTVASAIAGAVARDLMEKEVAAALERAMQASHAKGTFLSNMSHEMRTPMNAIIGMTAIGKSAPDAQRKDYAFGKIEDASVHLLGVINDILDMSKIEANKLELSPISFHFERMLRRVADVLTFRIDEKRQRFSVYIDRRIPAVLVGDDQRLSQVIVNLLSNATKFTPAGGDIHLRADWLDETDGLCTLQIEVADTGIGISPEQQARLFTSFEQAESNTARKFSGTGLGLAISRRIVEMMDGRIWIKSQLGQGSTFTFTVRLACGSADQQAGLPTPGAAWAGIRVLAVDDDPDVLTYFDDIMRRLGVACDTAPDGETALTIMREKGAYNIYFIDWRMPDMDGIALTQAIKARQAKDAVVVMITAAEWVTIEDEARAAGVDKYLPKPLFPSSLADCINECLGLDAAMPPTPQPAPADDFSGKCILLAEDVEINREIVLTLLETTRVTIDCAENGAQALALFEADPNRYDMIFMDVQMPEMDGYEATRRIRALGTPKAQSIPVVAMTANVFREDVERCLNAGMNDHLSKPLNFEDMLKKLRRYMV
ncbi:MAG: response regulator [Oscillospiraceae bacterium]|jgi:signal transduction histidine kinase/DNA-binding response OmpR family regulator|nr:response regulator [Oscillospiraceae bacterium]